MSLIIVKGNVGNDPELKFVKTANGDLALTTFSLAHTTKSKKNGEWVDGETTWYRVTVWGEKGEALIDNLEKGDKVLVSGTLKQTSYEAKDGTTKSSLEINVEEIGLVFGRKPRRQKDEPRW